MNSKVLIASIEFHSNDQLINDLNKLARNEKLNAAAIIARLMLIKERNIALRLGYKSLFSYCEENLKMDAGSIATRMQIASKCREFPELLDAFTKGALSQTAASKLCAYINEGNAKRLIEEASGKTVRQVEEMLARICESKEKPISSGIMRGSTNSSQSRKKNVALKPVSQVSYQSAASLFTDEPTEDESEEKAVSFNIRFSADEVFKEKLERLAEVLGEDKLENALATILEKAVDNSLERRDPKERQKRRERREQKRTARKKTRANDFSASKIVTQHVPRKVYDFVLKRAGYQCELVGKDRRRCTRRSRVQIDHIRPWAMNGDHNVDNLQALCASHNLLKRDLDFGDGNRCFPKEN